MIRKKKTKDKIFRDPLHNYIELPGKLCELFLDTPIFQRLRNIEQTSMRPLYPSAHHDRFAHSLGVFYLANFAFHYLKKNTDSSSLSGINLDDYKSSFLIAALMHDCGHAPFSHTFESYYNKKSEAKAYLFGYVDETFKNDYKEHASFGKGPADHEIFSSAILLEHYKAIILEYDPKANPLLIARMITGTTHSVAQNAGEEIENCLIRLINSKAIDVDKLDYIIRDTWASGVNNVSIDIHRLLSSLSLTKFNKQLVPTFNKSALSVVQSVVDGRNYLYNWLYSHHTVCYYNELLETAINTLSSLIPPYNSKTFLEIFFSRETFSRPVLFKNEETIYLPTDGDICFLLKQYINLIPEVNEILSRQSQKIPLWKTHAEFEIILKDKKHPELRAKLRRHAFDFLKPILGDEKITIITVKPKIAQIDENELYISIRGKTVPYDTIEKPVFLPQPLPENTSFFYLFIPNKFEDKIEECIKALQDARVSL